MGDWVDVASATSAKTKSEELTVRCTVGSSFLLRSGMEVAFVPPVLDVPRRARVSHVSRIDDMRASVRFSGVTASDAHELVGRHILVRRGDLADGALEGAFGDIVGYEVHDAKLGFVGAVSDVIENPAQALLEVEREGSAAALVPFVDGIVVRIDDEHRRIDIEAPGGLFEL